MMKVVLQGNVLSQITSHSSKVIFEYLEDSLPLIEWNEIELNNLFGQYLAVKRWTQELRQCTHARLQIDDSN